MLQALCGIEVLIYSHIKALVNIKKDIGYDISREEINVDN